MLFWIVIAVLTVVVVIALLLPLTRSSAVATGRAAGEAAVYRDQLAEIERDKASGLISAEDADYARAEVGRRLLAIGKEAEGAAAARKRHPLVEAFVVVLLPAVGIGLYLLTGSPGTPAAPLEARLANPGDNMDLLVAKAERHLAQNPGDGNGWDVLAPIYFKAMRLGDAEMAYRNALRILGPSAERLTGLAEVLVTNADGVVTDDARMAFENALKVDPAHPKAQFYLALGLEQAGRASEAKAAFETLARNSPPDAPWQPLVAQHIAKNGGGPLAGAAPPVASAPALGGPSAADVAAAQQMTPEQQMDMIRGMVASLDAKLKEEPNNFEGWMRLVRSYVMLKETDQAMAALKTGLRVFPADSERGGQLVALARELGLPAEEALK